MIEKSSVEIVDKWAIIVGMPDKSGDPSLHLHRIYDYKDKSYALKNLSDIKDLYPVAFIQAIKCNRNLD